jgi:hypothetical protein
MNLIDFHVTEIIKEEYDKMYKLYDMTEQKLELEKEDELWYNFLLGDGVKQTYRYCDEGGYYINTVCFNLSEGQKPYYVGFVGQH